MDDGCGVIVVVPVARFDSELAQALEEAENERDQKDKALLENTALGTEIYTLRRNLQVRVQNPAGTTPAQLPGAEISFYIPLLHSDILAAKHQPAFINFILERTNDPKKTQFNYVYTIMHILYNVTQPFWQHNND